MKRVRGGMGSLSEALQRSIEKLARSVDPAVFTDKFGASIRQLDTLVEQKTVTIGKLMEIAPPGTIDPSSTLYNSTMVLMAGLLVLAFIANAWVRPVASRFHLRD